MGKRPYIVIGDGIAAKIIIFYLAKYHSDIPVIQISKNDVYPSCSMTTTSVNCLRGTKRGISELGDLICDSYDEFVRFYNEFKPSGVGKSYETHIWDKGHESNLKFLKKFKDELIQDKSDPLNLKSRMANQYEFAKSDAFVISSEIYLNWLNQENTNHILDVVTSIEKENDLVKVNTLNRSYLGQKCFICAGVFNQNFLDICTDEKVKQRLLRSKPVSGTYASIELSDVENIGLDLSNDFVISIHGHNFIFRKDQKRFLIGATSENQSHVYIPNKVEFEKIYLEVRNFLSDFVKLPVFCKIKLYAGVREKGQKRLPFWGEIAPDIYMVSSLYKNGFTFANLAAKELIKF